MSDDATDTTITGHEENQPLISVVSPSFNEQENIGELYRRTKTACEAIVADQEFEIVLIDDGSSDDTWNNIRTIAPGDPAVVGIKLSRNHGHQKALSAGLSLSRGRRILILDADLQDPPELLGRMMALMDEGAEVVCGRRSQRFGESWLKRSTASLFYRLLELPSDVRIPVNTGDFRLMSRRAPDILNSMPEQHRFVRGMVSWIGLTQVPIEYDRDARFAGKTKYTLRRILGFALDAITGFSVAPLRLAAYLGALVGVVAIAVLVYTVTVWANGTVVPGWTSVMVVALFLGSAQLFATAIIGEYLGRLFMEAKRRPLYIIEEIARLPHSRAGSADSEPGL